MAEGRKPPWYRQTEVIDRACAYVAAYLDLLEREEDPPQFAQVRSSRFDALASLIFESTTFESAGLPEGETRALLRELGVDAIAPRRDRTPLIKIAHLRDIFDLIAGHAQTERVSVQFRDRSRGARDVVQHFHAWFELMEAAGMHALEIRGVDEEALAKVWAEQAVADGKLGGSVSDFLKLPVFHRRPFFLSAEHLRKVQSVLSEGLLPDDAKVGPGEYRIDHRIAGRATGFVAPVLISAAMEKLEQDARAAFAHPLTARDREAFELAARFSHRVVAIHPFPDFNGRLSRLVLSACLEWAAVPFPVSIKFDKKGRERYLYALRRGDRGDFRPMTVLVARAVVDGFEAIDAKLELAGLPRLLPPV